MDVNELKCKITEKIEDIIRRMKKGHKIDSLEKRLLLQDIHRLRTLTGEQFNWLLVQGIVEEKLLCEDPCFSFVLDPDPGPEPLPELNVVLTINHVVSCFEGADGEITATVTGGFAPYTYFWNDPFTQTTSTATNLTAGTYSVTVIDSLSTSTTKTITLTQPAKLTVQLNQINPTELGVTDGEIESIVSGGTIPYSYYWTGPNDFTSVDKDLIDLEVGEYTLTVTDANGCVAIESITLVEQIDYTPINYGLLYNGYAVTDGRKISSSDDWTLPTNADMYQIVGNGMHDNSFDYMSDRVYPDPHPRWNSPNQGNNSSGFNSIPAGMRSGNVLYPFQSFGQGAFHWWYYIFFEEPGHEPQWEHFRQMRDYSIWEHENFDGMINGYSVKLVNLNTELPEGQIGVYVGNDGKKYSTKVINGIEVTTMPLAETKFRNNDLIPFNLCDDLHQFTQTEWINLTTAGCAPPNGDWSLVPMEEPTGEPCEEPNNSPTANDDYLITDQDGFLYDNILTNDIDPDGDTLTVTEFAVNGTTYSPESSAILVNYGSVTIFDDGTIIFVPDEGFFGEVPTVNYTISDGKGGTDSANIYIHVLEAETPNSDPVAQDDYYTTPEGVALNDNVFDNDSDPDWDELFLDYFIVQGDEYYAGSTATISGVGTMIMYGDGSFTFTPQPGFYGNVPMITYIVSDGLGGMDSADVYIEVLQGEEPPVPVTPDPGLLYNWYVGHDLRKLSSSDDWRSPAKEDWMDLIVAAGGIQTPSGASIVHPDTLTLTPGGSTGMNFISPLGYRLHNGIFSIGVAATYFSTTEHWDYNINNGADPEAWNTIVFVHNTSGTTVVSDINRIYDTERLTFGYYHRLCRDASESELLFDDGVACDPYVGNDGKSYDTVKVGSLVWITKNLAETKFRNEDIIPFNLCNDLHSFTTTEWQGLTSSGCAPYNNDWSTVPMSKPTGGMCPDFADVNYGFMYNYMVSEDNRNISSSDDWRIPDFEDWRQLILDVGGFTLGPEIDYGAMIGTPYTWEHRILKVGGASGFNLKPPVPMRLADGTFHNNNDPDHGGPYVKCLLAGEKYMQFYDHETEEYYWDWVITYFTYRDSHYAWVAWYDSPFPKASNKCSGVAIRLCRDATENEKLQADYTACDPYVGNDGRHYYTVKIGDLIWTSQNLYETKFRNGDWIRGFDGGVYTPISDYDWANSTIAMLSAYEDDTSNVINTSEGTGILDTGIWNDSGIYKDQKPWNDGE